MRIDSLSTGFIECGGLVAFDVATVVIVLRGLKGKVFSKSLVAAIGRPPRGGGKSR